jgi:hypothetical protein
MDIYPVLFPASSNREDFLHTLSLFDDDTGDPLNLSGTTRANPGPFTAANWTVRVGAIITASVTPITIPDFPIGSQLSALALTVPAGLGILADDPVVISDQSGLNTMSGYVISYAPQTGALVVQIGVTFQFEIRSQSRNDGFGSDYNSSFDWGGGVPGGPAPCISAALGSGITHVDVGFIQIMIAETRMRQLRERTYLASLTLTDGVNTRQALVGKLPMQYGGVTN